MSIDAFEKANGIGSSDPNDEFIIEELKKEILVLKSSNRELMVRNSILADHFDRLLDKMISGMSGTS